MLLFIYLVNQAEKLVNRIGMAFNQRRRFGDSAVDERRERDVESVENWPNFGGLEESEWVLFSPSGSHFEDDDHLEDGSNNDILSSRSQDSDSEIEDSLIDSLSNEISATSMNRHSIYSQSNDLESRINNWRREQIFTLLNDLTLSPLDTEKLEFMKCWGIEEGNLKVKKPSTAPVSPNKEYHYGAELLKNYSISEIRTIRKIIRKFSKELTAEDSLKSKTSLPLSYLRILHERNLDLKLRHLRTHRQSQKSHQGHLNHQSHKTLQNIHQNNHNHPYLLNMPPNNNIGYLNNTDLEKYIPLFLKNLILEQRDKSVPFDTVEQHNFWDTDLKSCNSSVLSLSTNSILFKFNMNDMA